MYCVLLHPCVKFLFDIISFENAKSLLIMQWGPIVVICYDYIGHNNTFLGFVTFLVMSFDNLLFDNHESRVAMFI
jgi:hypothetical protein